MNTHSPEKPMGGERDGVQSKSFDSQKKRLLLSLAVLMAILGGVSGAIGEESALAKLVTVLFGVAISILVASWCHYDSLERDRRLSRLMRIGLLMVWILIFPIYAFRTRGLGGFKLLAHAFLVMCAVLVIALLSELLGEGIATTLAGVD